MSILLQKKNVGDYSYMSSPNIYYRAEKKGPSGPFCITIIILQNELCRILRIVVPPWIKVAL